MAEDSSTGAGRAPFLHRVGTAASRLGSLGSERPRLRAGIQYGAIALVFACLAAFLITQWSKLPNYDWHFRPGWLAVSLLTVLAFYAIQPEAWRLILHELGEHGDSLQLRAAWAKSLVARYVPTSALMVVGRVVMAERAGITQRVCLVSIIYELALGVCSAIIVGAYFFITLPRLEDVEARYAILVVIPIALAGLHPRIFKPLVDWGLGKLGREALPKALPYRAIALLLPIYMVGWALVGCGLFAFASALHDVSGSNFASVAAAYPVAFCVSVLTFIVPSGLGTRDATLAAALKPAVGALSVATAIAIAFRIFQTAVELLYVGSVTFVARRRRSLS